MHIAHSEACTSRLHITRPRTRASDVSPPERGANRNRTGVEETERVGRQANRLPSAGTERRRQCARCLPAQADYMSSGMSAAYEGWAKQRPSLRAHQHSEVISMCNEGQVATGNLREDYVGIHLALKSIHPRIAQCPSPQGPQASRVMRLGHRCSCELYCFARVRTVALRAENAA
jgi:hypothetical protein